MVNYAFVDEPGTESLDGVVLSICSSLFIGPIKSLIIGERVRIRSNNFGVDNYGDVWVDAEYTAPGGRTLKARSYLVVTIPVYVRYDQPEVSK